jgi:hypothetical protein
MIEVGGKLYDLAALPTGAKPCSQWIEGRLGLRAGVDSNREESNLLSLTGTEGQFVGHPAHNVVIVLPQLAGTKCIQYKSWHANDKVISEWFFWKRAQNVTLLYLLCCPKGYLLNVFTAIPTERFIFDHFFCGTVKIKYTLSKIWYWCSRMMFI